MDRDDIQHYIAARKAPPRWLRRLRRPRFSLWLLLAVVTACCIGFAFMYKPREYPRLEYRRSQSSIFFGRGGVVEKRWVKDTIRVCFGPGRYEEYGDYAPFGTLNEAHVPGVPRMYCHAEAGKRWVEGKTEVRFGMPYGVGPKDDHIPPLVCRRFQDLRTMISQHIDVDAPGVVRISRRSWLLSPDFPTLEEYIAKAKASEPAGQNTPAAD